VQDVARPSLAKPGDVGKLVAQAGGDDESACRDPVAGRQGHVEAGAVAVRGCLHDSVVDDLSAVALDLRSAGRQQLAGWESVA
jgi:hypothetical protein